jgi:hypothetical protein
LLAVCRCVAAEVFINSFVGNIKQAEVVSVMAEYSKKKLLAFFLMNDLQ